MNQRLASSLACLFLLAFVPALGYDDCWQLTCFLLVHLKTVLQALVTAMFIYLSLLLSIITRKIKGR